MLYTSHCNDITHSSQSFGEVIVIIFLTNAFKVINQFQNQKKQHKILAIFTQEEQNIRTNQHCHLSVIYYLR